MKLTDLTPSGSQWEMIKGVEEDLLKRRRNSRIGLLVALMGAVVQVLTELSDSGLVKNIGQLFRRETWQAWFENLDVYNLLALLLVGAGLLTWFLLRYTRVLMRESKEPFRYTFWVEPFECIGEQVQKQLKGDDNFHPHDERLRDLLHHDLTNHLSKRIRRLSVLDGEAFKESAAAMRAHIRIRGHYTIRTGRNGERILQVMPRVQISSSETPWHLTHPVTYQLEKPDPALDDALYVNQYEQVVERVYSRVATEVYNRIMTDVKEKVKLFPTNYLRAVALSVEAEDFARSNTIDAYDHAIELYKLALRYFRISTSTYFYKFTLSIFGIRTGIRYHHNLAAIEIGFAKCLIYIWYISALSGRKRNSLFSVPQRLREIVAMLMHTHNKLNSRNCHLKPAEPKDEIGNAPKADPEILRENRLRASMAYLTFPEDTWMRSTFLKPSKRTYEKQKKVLFEAYVVQALALNILGYTKKAEELLENAKSVNPSQCERNPLYLMASGLAQAEVEPAISNLRRASELAPDFEIVQYLLARHLEKHFRNQNELTLQRAQNVLEEYEKTLQINHGNIASLAAEGYIYWLIGDLDSAKKAFTEGLEYKKIIQEIYPGELYMGLARISAEVLENDPTSADSKSREFSDHLNKAFEYFSTAVSLDPGTGLSYPPESGQATTDYFEFITPAILSRYKKYKEGIADKLNIEATSAGSGTPSESLKKKNALKNNVFSYILNDYGNACLNFYYRFGELKQLENARDAFKQATELYPESKTAWMGLSSAYAALGQLNDEKATTAKAAELNNRWGEAIITLARTQLYPLHNRLEEHLNDALNFMQEIIKIRNETGLKAGTDDITGTIISPGEPGIANPAGKTEADSDQLKKKYQELKKHYKAAEDVASTEVKKILDLFHPVINDTQFSSLYKGYGFNEKGDGIDAFLNKELQKDRLNESDVNALKMYAEIISHNIESNAFARALKLLLYIDRHFLSTDFNILRNLDQMSGLQEKYFQVQKFVPKPETSEVSDTPVFSLELLDISSVLAKYTSRLQNVVRSWVQYDPFHYTSVWWCQIYLGEKEYSPILKAAQTAISLFDVNKSEGLNRLWAVEEYKSMVKLVENGNANNAARGMEQVIKIDALKESYVALFIRSWSAATDFDINDALPILQNTWNATEETASPKKQVDILKKSINLLTDAADLLPVWNFLLQRYCDELSQKELADGFITKGKLHRDRTLPEFQKSIAAISQAIAINPADPENYNELGVTFFSEGKFDLAISQFLKSYNLSKTEPTYLTNIANSYEQLQQPDKAIHWFEQAIQQAGPLGDKESAKFHDSFGRYLYRTGNFQKAVQQFEKASKLDPKNGLYAINMGDSLKRIAGLDAEFASVEKAYQEGILAEPDNSGYYNILGIFYFEKRNFKKAAAAFETATSKNDEVAVYFLNLGDAFLEIFKWKEAEEAFKKAAKLVSDPESELSAVNKAGLASYRDQRYQQAKEYFEQAVRLKNTEAILHANAGDASLMLKQYADAEEYYNQSLQLNTNNINAISGLGQSLLRQRKYASALATFVDAHLMQPYLEQYYFNVWSTALRVKDATRKSELLHHATRLKQEYDSGMKSPYTQKLIALLNFLAGASRFSSPYLSSYFGLLSSTFTSGFKQGWQGRRTRA